MCDDWDLYAVVRSCCSSSSTSSSSTSFSASTSSSADNHSLYIPYETTTTKDRDLKQICLPKSKLLIPISPLSVMGRVGDIPPPPPPPENLKRHSVFDSIVPSPKSKRRKVQTKRVCQVAAEDMSNDNWSWRKYGQKPIKGSPYPRGYYKCSTLKSCLARKQVEQDRSAPGMFVMTYTAEHNHPMPTHRTSHAGIARLKHETGFTSTSAVVRPPEQLPVPLLHVVTTEKTENNIEDDKEGVPEVDEVEDDEFDASEMAVSDDFFEGLEEFTVCGDKDCLSDQVWGNNGASTIDGSG